MFELYLSRPARHR